MCEYMDKTYKKLKKQFGENSIAAVKIHKRNKELSTGLLESEDELKDLLSNNILGGTYKAPAGGTVVALDRVLFIVLENCFGWLNKEGLLQDIPLTTREVALSSEVCVCVCVYIYICLYNHVIC